MGIFADFLISLTNFFGGNLGTTIIFIGVFSRLIFHPFLKTSLRQTKVLQELRPKLDEAKKKHGHDRKRHAEEQAKIYREAGFNPLAGCLAPIIQLVVAIVLFNAISNVVKSGLNTSFLIWDLAQPDTFKGTFGVEGFWGQLPGVLVILTAVATLLQSKMMLPEPVKPEKQDSKKEMEKKQDLASALTASQGQFVFLFPFLILFTGRLFPSGLALFWLVSTVVGLFQQYYIVGLGGLNQWLKILKR
ncbi:MAG TPA: YidC/Oxa1 family membrane protein insertase [Candidatus Nanoarchaeia archaeon]